MTDKPTWFGVIGSPRDNGWRTVGPQPERVCPKEREAIAVSLAEAMERSPTESVTTDDVRVFEDQAAARGTYSVETTPDEHRFEGLPGFLSFGHPHHPHERPGLNLPVPRSNSR